MINEFLFKKIIAIQSNLFILSVNDDGVKLFCLSHRKRSNIHWFSYFKEREGKTEKTKCLKINLHTLIYSFGLKRTRYIDVVSINISCSM